MTVIPKENVVYDTRPVPIENKKSALMDELDYAHRAKEQAIQLNYRLENRLREAQREIERLNEEINQLNKEKLEKERLYKLALDENTELEEMNRIMMNLVYFFTKRELGL